MIICVGTTPVLQRTMLFERLTLDAVNRTADVHDYASGKAVNAARVLHTLGEAVIAAGFVGGQRGQALIDDVKSTGLRQDFVTVEPQTRQCVTLIDRAAGTATELVEESKPVSANAWLQLEKLVFALAAEQPDAVWLFAGTLPPGAPSDAYARWLPRLTRANTRLLVDLQGDPLRQMLKHPRIVVKVNREELGATFGLPVDSDARLRLAMQRAVSEGGAVVVTLGRDGAVAADRDGVWRIPSPRVQTVSAVGSGDSFAAGLAAGLRRGLPLPQACALAAACGAANAMTPYAGHLKLEDVERLAAEVQVQPA